MKWKVVFAAAAISLIAIALVAALVVNYAFLDDNGNKQFLVGVTFCGSTTQEAKILIDRVKNSTNLFVLQSGPLRHNETAVKEIGDYAISNGLHFAAYFDMLSPPQMASWVGIAEQRWGDMFAGVYYGDEPGGKMLDAYVNLSEGSDENNVTLNVYNNASDTTTNVTIVNPDVTFSSRYITKSAGGSLTLSEDNMDISYQVNGEIIVLKWENPQIIPNPNDIYQLNGNITVYYPNGTITLKDIDGDFFTMENGTTRISQVESYEGVLSKHPIPDCDAAAEIFANKNQKKINGLSNQWRLSNRSFPILTSDYSLYWWDYQSGYDLILAQLGWNNTVAQEIGLVRGAANLQNKRWGTIITWTYTKPPYLTSGEEIYEQMRMSYEAGAEYVIIFNYAEDMEGPYGTLQEEHFDALERFWNDVAQNPTVAHGGIQAEAAFVLPKNYGWGMRNPDDIVWGLWEPTAEAKQSWTRLQDALDKHGLRLDIVYDDAEYSFVGKYRQVYFWNQTI